MDRHGLVVGVVIEYDNFQQLPGLIRTNDQHASTVLAEDPQRVPRGTTNGGIADAVLAGAAGHLHRDNISCPE